MAKRSINKKRAARVRKAMRGSLPAYFDLVQWLKDRGYAQTTGEANDLILAGRVRSESHKVGIVKREVVQPITRAQALAGGEIKIELQDTVDRRVSVDLRDSIEVLPA